MGTWQRASSCFPETQGIQRDDGSRQREHGQQPRLALVLHLQAEAGVNLADTPTPSSTRWHFTESKQDVLPVLMLARERRLKLTLATQTWDVDSGLHALCGASETWLGQGSVLRASWLPFLRAPVLKSSGLSTIRGTVITYTEFVNKPSHKHGELLTGLSCPMRAL